MQLDVFVPGNDTRRVQEEVATSVANRLEEEIGPLNERINLTDGLTTGLSEAAIIERVIQSFNNERYWEAQETAEAIWNKTKDPHEKNIVQGVILVGAALVHHQRGEDQVCLSILRRALAKLEDFERVSKNRRSFLRIDIEALKKDVQEMTVAGKARSFKLQTLE